MSEREQRPRQRGKASDQQNVAPPAKDKSPQTSNRSDSSRREQRPAKRPPTTARPQRPASGSAPAARKADIADKAPKGYYLPDFDDLDELDDFDLDRGMDDGLEPDEPEPPKPAKRPQQRKPREQQPLEGKRPPAPPAAPQGKAPQARPPQAQKPQQLKPQSERQPQPAKPQQGKQPLQGQSERKPQGQPQLPKQQPKPQQPEKSKHTTAPQAKAQPPKTPHQKPAEPTRAAERPPVEKPPVVKQRAERPRPERRPVETRPEAKQPEAKQPPRGQEPRKQEPRPAHPPRRVEPKPVAPSAGAAPGESPAHREAKRQRVREPQPATEEPKRVKQPAARPARTQPNGFAKLGVSKTMLAALDAAGYLEPTPVQEGLIPRALEGIDVMGQARTGTGKTAAFAIPILEKIEARGHGAMAQALVLVPTRELAVQVRDECGKLALGRELRIAAVYGGKPIRKQAEELHRGVDFVIGTPGRVIDMTNRGLLDFRDIRFVVLDEADRMLDIGFRPDIEKILRRCPESRQSMLLSATIAPPIKRLAERYMRDPEMLDFSANDVAVETIEQHYFSVDPERKFDLLIKLMEREQPRQAIIFCRTKRGTERLHRRLSEKFSGADTIHGDLAQSARDRVMAKFREGRVRYLVATDVVGRGIDVSGISHIINFDIPAFCDDYVHRVGRTGRMGREGVAFTFVTPEEGNELTRIEMRINILLKRDEIPGFSSLAKPLATGDLDELTGEEAPPPEAKPVYGKATKRYRRAL